MKKKVQDIQLNWYDKMGPIYRLMICLAVAAIGYLLLLSCDLSWLIRTMAGWDIFCLAMLTLSWFIFSQTSTEKIRMEATKQDGSRAVVFTINLISIFASLFAVFLLLTDKDESGKSIDLPITIAGMALSWLLVHTIFTFRYAHLYYGDDADDPTVHAAGLDFPGEEKPDYLDFAYFSFVIGMTFQVSDTQIQSRKLRRLVLMHSLLSFGFNTIIVALTINVVAGLKK